MNFGHLAQPGNSDAQREARLLALMGGGTHATNCYLNFEIASSILTVTLVTAAGHAPSASNPILAPFHDATAATGKPVIRRVAQRTRLQIGSTKTMAFSNATAGRLWFVLFDDTSVQPAVQRLGVINCLSSTSVYPLGAWPFASSTATPASAAQTFYTDVAVTSMPYVVLGYATWESGLSTAGTWDALPTRVRMYGPTVPLPGTALQPVTNLTGAVATGSTVIPADDTTPQNTEGDQYLSQAYTPTSAANLLALAVSVQLSNNSTSSNAVAAIFQDTTASALSVGTGTGDAAVANTIYSIPINHVMLAATSSSTTFKVRAGFAAAGTTTFNGFAGARKYGGVANSFLTITEIVA